MNLENIKKDIEEKTNTYKSDLVERYFQYMAKHYGKLAEIAWGDYSDLSRELNSDAENNNFLAIKDLLQQYEEALMIRKLYVDAVLNLQDNGRLAY